MNPVLQTHSKATYNDGGVSSETYGGEAGVQPLPHGIEAATEASSPAARSLARGSIAAGSAAAWDIESEGKKNTNINRRGGEIGVGIRVSVTGSVCASSVQKKTPSLPRIARSVAVPRESGRSLRELHVLCGTGPWTRCTILEGAVHGVRLRGTGPRVLAR